MNKNKKNISPGLMKRIGLSLLFHISYTLLLWGQTSSFSFQARNQKLSTHIIDSIFINNPLCQKYNEATRLDTLYWNQYPSVSLDSISLLKEVTANELFRKALDFKQSGYYSDRPFNLLGTFRETEYRNDSNTLQNIKTKVNVYDPGFTKGNLVKAQTQKCEEVYKSPDYPFSILDGYKNALGGAYSNLYYILDLDFIRMYNIPYSPELGPDKRIWSTHNFNPKLGQDIFRYYKAFKKDSSIYVVLVNNRKYSIMDRVLDPKSKIKVVGISPKNNQKDVTKVFKYALINLRTNTIEKTGYYINSIPDSSSIFPSFVTSYEASYKLIGDKYYLEQVSLNDFLFNPKIDHISLSGIFFRVDSVITAPEEVKKIRDSEADPRKENYLEQHLKNNNWKGNEKY